MTILSFRKDNPTLNLGVYSLAHAIVDATCAALIFSIPFARNAPINDIVSLIILYNILAFGSQFILGYAIDRFHVPKLAVMKSYLLLIISVIMFNYSPATAIIIAGIGNALFHVGAGSISLKLSQGKAAAPGVFVAPGAIGILIGTAIGRSGIFMPWQFISIIVIMGILTMLVRSPETILVERSVDGLENNKSNTVRYFWLILILMMIAISIRSLVGSVLAFPWKSDPALLLIFTASIFLGKALGGIIADRFGWMKIGLGSLLLSIPLLVFGSADPYLAIIGIFLFNMTMPITLVVVSNILPGRQAFAFGLTCLALIAGAMPSFYPSWSVFGSMWSVSILTAISAIAIYFGLHSYFKRMPAIVL